MPNRNLNYPPQIEELTLKRRRILSVWQKDIAHRVFTCMCYISCDIVYTVDMLSWYLWRSLTGGGRFGLSCTDRNRNVFGFVWLWAEIGELGELWAEIWAFCTFFSLKALMQFFLVCFFFYYWLHYNLSLLFSKWYFIKDWVLKNEPAEVNE